MFCANVTANGGRFFLITSTFEILVYTEIKPDTSPPQGCTKLPQPRGSSNIVLHNNVRKHVFVKRNTHKEIKEIVKP